MSASEPKAEIQAFYAAECQLFRSNPARQMPEARLSKHRVSDVYSKIAPLYDSWAWLTETKARSQCLDLAAIRDGEDVLEVAIGTGRAFVKILKANPSGRNEGIDLTAAMLNRAE